MEAIKKVWKSRTMIFGMALITLGGVQSFLPSVEAFIKPEMYGSLTSAIGVVVMILRQLTTTSIADK